MSRSRSPYEVARRIVQRYSNLALDGSLTAFEYELIAAIRHQLYKQQAFALRTARRRRRRR